MQFRSGYNYDRDAASVASGFVPDGQSATQQQFKDECDINVIARRFGLTGLMPAPSKLPEYGDFTAVTDYHSALNALKESDAAFLTLPSEVRERFENDPGQLLAFLGDEGNRQEAMDLGLLERPEEVVATPPLPSS